MGAPQITWLILSSITVSAALICHGERKAISFWAYLIRMLGTALLLLWGGFFTTAKAQIPVAAEQYHRTLIRAAQAVWGLDAPIATFAAQIHQESAWQAHARSPMGAAGLAQFMPATADWMANLYPRSLGPAQPYNPGWALRALVQYDWRIYQSQSGVDDCERWAFTLAGYNGGPGWIGRERRLALAKGANPRVWFGSVEHYNAGRSQAAFRENRAYPRAILLRWEALYVKAGWGRGVCQNSTYRRDKLPRAGQPVSNYEVLIWRS